MFVPCHAPRAGGRSWRPSQGAHHWDSQLMGGYGGRGPGTAPAVPGVLALLGDLGSDDFMALLRTNFHPGRESKQV